MSPIESEGGYAADAVIAQANANWFGKGGECHEPFTVMAHCVGSTWVNYISKKNLVLFPLIPFLPSK